MMSSFSLPICSLDKNKMEYKFVHYKISPSVRNWVNSNEPTLWIECANDLLGSFFKTKQRVSLYDIANLSEKYVCFTENFHSWSFHLLL